VQILITKLTRRLKIFFFVFFGAVVSVKFVSWYSYLLTFNTHLRIPNIFWEGAILLTFIVWNPKGIRIILLAVLGFFFTELILYTFFISGLSGYPFWHLFREVYSFLGLDSLYAFLSEFVLLLAMIVSLFRRKNKPPASSILLDDKTTFDDQQQIVDNTK